MTAHQADVGSVSAVGDGRFVTTHPVDSDEALEDGREVNRLAATA